MPKLAPIPHRGTLTRRILRAYDSATDAQRETGRDWYSNAQKWVQATSSEFSMDTETVAAILAVLSPRCDWSDNLIDARTMIETAHDETAGEYPPVTALGANRDKAAYILNGADPNEIVRGPKVSTFWRNLLGDPDAVTIDSWAMRAVGMPDVPTPRTHREVESAYRRAAKLRNETPSAMQAIVWVVTRGKAD